MAGFFKKLRGSDEKNKKRWLWIFVSSSAVIIILIWVIYISHNLKNVAIPSTEIGQKSSFWQIFKNGLLVIGDNLKSSLNYYWQIVRNKFFTPESFMIQP
jgi:hypothetical protein